MTGHEAGGSAGDVRLFRSSYNRQDMAAMRDAIDAVCGELGIARGAIDAREAVAKRVMAAYDVGRKHPLNLVHAGLGGSDLHA